MSIPTKIVKVSGVQDTKKENQSKIKELELQTTLPKKATTERSISKTV